MKPSFLDWTPPWVKNRLTKFNELSRRRKWILGLVLISWSLVTSIVVYRHINVVQINTDKKNMTIHYVGRYTSEYEKNLDLSNPNWGYSKFHEAIFRKFIDDLKENNTGWDFEFKAYDNKSNPSVSDSIYGEIASHEAKSGQYNLVIDNSWGKEIEACKEKIKESGLPVIALNADHNNLDFGDNSMFIGNDDNAPHAFAKFITEVLGVKKVNFISEIDYKLDRSYEEEFQKNGIIVSSRINVKYNNGKITSEDSTLLTDTFESHLSKQKDLLLVLNVHSVWGSFILNLINEKYDHMRVLSPGYSTTSWTENLSPIKSNEFLTVTLSEDAISRTVSDYVKFFRSSPEDSLYTRINFHEYVSDGITAKELIQDYLNQVDLNIERGNDQTVFQREIITENEVYNFNRNGGALELDRELTFSTFRKGVLSAYPKQLNRLGQVIPNVFFGMEIESIYDLDLKSGRFGVDFYYWLKYDSSHSERVEKMVEFTDLKIDSRKELMNQLIDSQFVYKLFKVSAICSQEFDLKDYPMDDHELKISAHILDPNDGVRISFDKECLSTTEDFLNQINLENWQPTDYEVTVDNTVSKSSRGLVPSYIVTKSKSLSFWIKVKRESLHAILGLVLPLVIIGFIAIGMMFLRDREFGHIGDATAGLLISTILFSMSLIEFTPSSGVLKKTDWIFWITLLIVLLNFIIMVFDSSIFRKGGGRTKLSKYLGYTLLIAYPIAVVCLVLM